MPDHIHLCLSVPPWFSISFVIGFLKGKSAVRIHREIMNNRRVTGLHFQSQKDIALARSVWMWKPYENISVSRKNAKTPDNNRFRLKFN